MSIYNMGESTLKAKLYVTLLVSGLTLAMEFEEVLSLSKANTGRCSMARDMENGKQDLMPSSCTIPALTVSHDASVCPQSAYVKSSPSPLQFSGQKSQTPGLGNV